MRVGGFIFRFFAAFFRREASRKTCRDRAVPSPAYPKAQTRRALSEAEIKEKMSALPLARVVHVVDGDTVIVSKGWSEITVRLDAVDCPEDGQPWGDTPKYGLIKMIGGRGVRLEEHGVDIHGRTLATVYVQSPRDGEWLNVNERMVTLGHAWVMRRLYDHLPKDRQDKLNRLERWARTKKVGLWKSPNPVPPWKWRRGG